MKFYKLLLLTSLCISASVLTTACSDENQKKAHDFGERFASFVEKDQRDSIVAYYPGAEYAEEFSIASAPNDFKVEKGENATEYVIAYNDSVSMVVNIDNDGQVSVVESKGLFHYPANKLNLASQLGAVKPGLNDEALAKRMLQVEGILMESFNDYVNSRKDAIKNLGFTVTYEPQFGMEEGKGYYTLKNTTDQPIGGDEYELTYVASYMYAGMESESSETKLEPGKDIPANGSIQLPESFNWHGGRELKAVTMHTPTMEKFLKTFKPTGEEYAKYVKVHGDKVEKSADLSYGPYTLVGKLGGKYPVHVILNKGMKDGYYYYDKNGSKNTLSLTIKSFNPKTGDLSMDEMNDKGAVSGTFSGILTPTEYTGKMTSFAGKTYEFTLKVE